MGDTENNNFAGIRMKTIIIVVIIVGLLLAFLIPLIAFLSVNHMKTSDKVLSSTHDSMKWEAHNIEGEWQRVIDENLGSLEAVALSPSTISYMEDTANEELADSELSYLQSVESSLSEDSKIILTGADGMQLLSTEGDLKDVSERDYFAKAIGGENAISDVIVSKATEALLVTFAVPIKSESGDILGIVQRNYDLFNFHKILAGQNDHAFLVDSLGMLAAHSQFAANGDSVEDLSHELFMTQETGEGLYRANNGQGTWYNLYHLRNEASDWTICVVKEEEK